MSTGSLVAETLWKEIETTRSVTDDQISILHFLFGKNLEKATRIVDQRGVKKISGEPSGRSIFQVVGESRSKEEYLCFPEHYCACYSFFYDVVNRGEQLCCKHQLAARLAASVGACVDVKVQVTEEIEGTRFNTGISAMMEFINAAYKWDNLPRSIAEAFVLLLSPYAPHMAEELWRRLGHSNSLAYEPFPKANPFFLKDATVVLPVQINGKTRGTIQVEEACTEEDAFKLASLDQKLSKYLDGKTIKKRIYVPGKILNVILDLQNAKVSR